MHKSVKLAPPHSIIFIMDPSNRNIPEKFANSSIIFNEDGIVMKTLAEVDGETEIELTNSPARRLTECSQLAFEGIVKFPSKTVYVHTSSGEVIMKMRCGKEEAKLRIWTTGDPDPDKITVEIVEGE